MPRSDFDGDGRSDILWRRTVDHDVLTSNWLGTETGGFFVNDAIAMDEFSIGDVVAVGDFNGDGRADTLWRFIDTEIYLSFTALDGAFMFAWTTGFVAEVPVTWQVAGAGDFDGDGLDDILWASDDGRISNWLSNGDYTFTINDANAMTNLVSGNDIKGIGDFNADGNDDLVFHFSNGVLSLAYGNDNGGWVFDDPFGQVALDWQIVGVGDFDGDGNDDILWRNANGTVSNWLWAGGLGFGTFTINDANALVHVPVDWQIVGVGDYDGDGSDDILWRNTVTGAVSDWLATPDGGWFINDAAAMTAAPLEWSVHPASPGIGAWDY